MSQQIGVLDKSFRANSDLSAKQYYVVEMAASGTPMGVKLATSTTDKAIGILQNEPDMNEAALVRLLGTSKAAAGTPIVIGDQLTVDSGGRVVKAFNTADFSIGIALEDVTASSTSPYVIEILITHCPSLT